MSVAMCNRLNVPESSGAHVSKDDLISGISQWAQWIPRHSTNFPEKGPGGYSYMFGLLDNDFYVNLITYFIENLPKKLTKLERVKILNIFSGMQLCTLLTGSDDCLEHLKADGWINIGWQEPGRRPGPFAGKKGKLTMIDKILEFFGDRGRYKGNDRDSNKAFGKYIRNNFTAKAMEKSFQLLTSGNLRAGGWDLEGWNEEIRRHPNIGDQLSNINTLRNFLKLFNREQLCLMGNLFRKYIFDKYPSVLDNEVMFQMIDMFYPLTSARELSYKREKERGAQLGRMVPWAPVTSSWLPGHTEFVPPPTSPPRNVARRLDFEFGKRKTKFGNRKVHFGSKGGRYIIKGGKKKYI